MGKLIVFSDNWGLKTLPHRPFSQETKKLCCTQMRPREKRNSVQETGHPT